MKIRTGFVSNSSSSSFLVIFPRDPVSEEDLHEMLFGAEEKVLGPDYYDDKFKLPSKWAAHLIWRDITAQKKTPAVQDTKDDIEMVLNAEYRDALITELVVASMQQKPVYRFYYSDHGSSAESILETGVAFEKVQAFKINYH